MMAVLVAVGSMNHVLTTWSPMTPPFSAPNRILGLPLRHSLSSSFTWHILPGPTRVLFLSSAPPWAPALTTFLPPPPPHPHLGTLPPLGCSGTPRKLLLLHWLAWIVVCLWVWLCWSLRTGFLSYFSLCLQYPAPHPPLSKYLSLRWIL